MDTHVSFLDTNCSIIAFTSTKSRSSWWTRQTAREFRCSWVMVLLTAEPGFSVCEGCWNFIQLLETKQVKQEANGPALPTPLEVGSRNPSRGSGELCKLPQRGPGRRHGRQRILRYFEPSKRVWCHPCLQNIGGYKQLRPLYLTLWGNCSLLSP